MHPVYASTPKNGYSYLKPYSHIGLADGIMYSGIVMTGPRPCWIMVAQTGGIGLNISSDGVESASYLLQPLPMCGKNVIRVHPMIIDGPLKSFTALHNINSPFGFAYVNEKGSFRIAQLPAQFNYDFDWACCKIVLHRCTQKLAYHNVSQTHVLATSHDTPFSLDRARYAAAVAAGVIDDGDEMPESETKPDTLQGSERLPGMYEPNFQQFQLELVSPLTWETVDVFSLLEGEQILCIQTVDLISTETLTGRKEYVAVGTAFLRSEELSCRGRVLIFEIIDVVPEPNNPQTNHKFKLFCKTDEKAPVTALCAVNGCLLTAIGTKIIMYTMEEQELNGIAFLDVNIFVVSISAVKNLILISDVFKSVWFVVFQEDPPKICPLGKDHHPVQVYGSDFIVDDTSLAFVVSDSLKNIHLLSYAPYAVQSQGGQRLIRRGEMHTGEHIHAFSKLRCRPSLVQDEWVPSKQYATIGGTHGGGLVIIHPVSEKMFKRLYSLYSRMVTHLEHACGLNPRGYRHVYNPIKSIAASSVVTGPPGPRGILDGGLLYNYTELTVVKQHELAVAIGSRPDRIMDDLLGVARSVEYF